MSYRRGPRSLSTALGELRGDLAPETLLGEVQRVWRSAVGDAIAAEATPSDERGGVITVSCSASVWAQELDLMSLQIVARVNEMLGADRVGKLRCIAL